MTLGNVAVIDGIGEVTTVVEAAAAAAACAAATCAATAAVALFCPKTMLLGTLGMPRCTESTCCLNKDSMCVLNSHCEQLYMYMTLDVTTLRGRGMVGSIGGILTLTLLVVMLTLQKFDFSRPCPGIGLVVDSAMTAFGTGPDHFLGPFREAPDLGAGSGVDPEGVEDCC